MNASQAEKAINQIQLLLENAVVDELRIFSAVLHIGFYRVGATENIPNSIWVTILGDATFSRQSLFPNNFPSDTFFNRRAQLLSELYNLMGSSVTSVKIKSSGFLEIHFNDVVLTCFHDGNDDAIEDEVWSITSSSPAPYEEHAWNISLDKSGQIYLKSPNI